MDLCAQNFKRRETVNYIKANAFYLNESVIDLEGFFWLCRQTPMFSTELSLKVKMAQTSQVLRYSEHICGTFLMRRPNCYTNSLWFSLCLVHLSGQNLTFHVHFHACLFILLRYERTVSLYVFGRTSIQDPVFSSIYGQIAACFGALLCSCQLFSKHSSVICLRFHPFQFLCLFYGSAGVHLIEWASAGRFILLRF